MCKRTLHYTSFTAHLPYMAIISLMMLPFMYMCLIIELHCFNPQSPRPFFVMQSPLCSIILISDGHIGIYV